MPELTPDILAVKDLRFSYDGRSVFDGASFAVARGDMVGIIGGNGSGKTTLVKLLLGLLRPSAWTVRWAWKEGKAPKGKIGYIAQDAAHTKTVLPTSVEEVVATGAYFATAQDHVHAAEACDYDSIDRALDHVGMAHLRKRRINELSGGQRQRVYIARALIAHPEALIMDEPMAGVDAETQEQLGVLLHHLSEVHGITVIMISHDREEVRRRMRTVLSLGGESEAALRQAFPTQRVIRLPDPREIPSK